MRSIEKSREPASLAEHRHADPEDYSGYAHKDELRAYLIREQRGICCYCTGRIKNEYKKMKIEHWRSQERYPAERLRYSNLLGACTGNDGQPSGKQHCDSSKGNRDLSWNPANPTHRIESRIRYQGDGKIESSDPAFDSELNEVLNLNLAVLKQNRKAVLDGILAWWRLRGPVPRARFERERARWQGGHGDLTSFCQVAVWWIDQRLGRMV